MSFEYGTYLRSNAIIPICILSLVIIATILIIISTSVKINQKRATKDEALTSFVICMGICLCFIPMNVRTLSNGGVYLLNESKNDVVSQTGVIEKIYEPSKEYPNFKYDHKYGADIFIDGEMYFMAEAGDFKAGDLVTITYLPKSKVVLSIYHAEQEQ